MSNHERDARLGLTGLTPAQREERLRALEEALQTKQAEAQADLDRKRGIVPAAPAPTPSAASPGAAPLGASGLRLRTRS